MDENPDNPTISVSKKPPETTGSSLKNNLKFGKNQILIIALILIIVLIGGGSLFLLQQNNQKSLQITPTIVPTQIPVLTSAPTLTVSVTKSPPVKALSTPTPTSASTGTVSIKFLQWSKPPGAIDYLSSDPVTASNIGVHVTTSAGVQTNYVGNPPQWTSPSLSPGTYSVSADEPPNHSFKASDCTGNSECQSNGNCSRSVSLKAGENVLITCYFAH